MDGVETRRLKYLVELARLGSMRAVAEVTGTTTSTVSQQIAALARELGAALVEPDGRRVRLTPAGRRLAGHAVAVLAAERAARADLDPAAEPAGTVRVAGFATSIRRGLLPLLTTLDRAHPAVEVVVLEHEPREALDLLAADRIDLALVYDYTLAPIEADPALDWRPVWSAPWSLAVPAPAAAGVDAAGSAAVIGAFRDAAWIGNSRDLGDEEVLRALASAAGFRLVVTHLADSLDLVEDLILAGLGVGLLPADRRTAPGVALLPLTDPPVRLRAYAVTRRGEARWPALRLVLDRLAEDQPDRTQQL
jgi:DNA-binding transcriptional LysR family regulator